MSCRFIRSLQGLVPRVRRQVRPVVGRDGEPVATLVLGMARMALEPVERDLVPAEQRQEFLPEVRVLHLREPLPLPVHQPPFRDCLYDIGRIAPHFHRRVVPADGPQAFDDGEEFHAVVGGQGETAAQFLFVPCALQDCAVTAGPGIAAGGPVREKIYDRPVFHSADCSNPQI